MAGRLLLLAVLMAPPLTGAAAAADADWGDGSLYAEVLEAGEYQSEGQLQVTLNSNVPDRTQETTAGVTFLTHGTRIPARLGASFGFRFNIRNLDYPGTIQINVSVRHPSFPAADGAVSDHYEMKQDLVAKDRGAGGFLGYRLDDAAEVVPGRWRFECSYRGKIIMTQDFVLVSEEDRRKTAAANRKRAELAASVQPGSIPTAEQAAALACRKAPAGTQPQAIVRLEQLAKLGYHYAANDAPDWRALLQDEGASIYGRMIAARMLLPDEAARDFLAAQVDACYRRYAINAAALVLDAWRSGHADIWAHDLLTHALLANRLLTTMTGEDEGGGYPEGDDRDMLVEMPAQIRAGLGIARPAASATAR